MLLLLACTSVATDGNQAHFRDDHLHDHGGDDGHLAPLLAGSDLCPTLQSAQGDGADACYDLSLDGAPPDGGCFRFDDPGSYLIDMAPVDCEWRTDEDPLGADTISVEVVAIDGVDVEPAFPLEELATALAPTALECDVEALTLPSAGEPIQAVRDQSIRVEVHLRDEAGEVVGWVEAAGSFRIEGGQSTVVTDTGGAIVAVSGTVDSTLFFDIGDAEWEVATIHPVETSAIRDIDVVTAVALGEGGVSQPAGFRAVATDAEGEPVFGAPFRWTFSGTTLTSGTDAGLPGLDYAMAGDACASPETVGEQRATVTASLGLFQSASAEVVWTPRTEPGDASEWTEPEDCASACGCASAGGPVAPLLLFGALALRRRRS